LVRARYRVRIRVIVRLEHDGITGRWGCTVLPYNAIMRFH